MASFIDNFSGKVWDWTKPFQRTGQFPLDRSAMFSSYADAVKYAKGDASDPDSRALCATSYVGQIITVHENGKVKVYKIEEDRSLSGIGGGALSANNYTEALSLATSDTIGQIVYVSNEEPVEGGEPYSAGPYIVTGEGTVAKLGTTTATGDLSGDVTTLKTDVAKLKVDVAAVDGKITDAVDALDIEQYATTEYVDQTFVKIGGYVAFTQEEKNKLASVAEGAQVNVIEKVIFNGEEVVADAQTKTITLNTPVDVVRGLADGEKFLSLDTETGKLGTTIGLTYFTDTTGETPIYEIRLTDKNGNVAASIDAKSFVKDGMLDSVELIANPADQAAGTYLVFTWNTEAGLTEPMYVPVTDLIDVYEAGDGININNKVIKVVAKTDDPYIEVTTEGIASKGIDNAILIAKNAVIGTEGDAESAVTLYGVKKYAANLVSAHDSAVTTALGGKADKDAFDTFVSETNATLSGIKVTDVDSTVSNGVNLVKSEAGVISVAVNASDLGASLVGTPDAVGPVSAVSVKLGSAITNNNTEIISAGSSVHSAIQTLSSQIQAAVAGGVTSVNAGAGISVNSDAATTPVVSVKIKENSALVADENGLDIIWREFFN